MNALLSSGSSITPSTPSSYLQPVLGFSQYPVLPTDEILRMSFLLPSVLQSARPVLLVGPRGSGKSTIVSHIVRLLSSKGYPYMY
jgi:MoxR-like ATPase